VWISDTWQGHKNRKPPSAEPGTDYATAYGTDLAMAEAGRISVVDNSPGGGEGRRMSVDLDDGRRVSYIHLDSIQGWVGLRVVRGQTGVCRSGASGNGSSWYYGPHVHVSLWERPGMSYSQTIDFEAHVGPPPEPEPPPPPPPEEDDMPKNSGITYVRSDGVTLCAIANLGSGAWSEWQDGGGAYNSAMAEAFDMPTFAAVSESHRNNLYAMCSQVRETAATHPPSSDPNSHPLTTPAWVGGFFLGLIGLIEVLRFVVGLIT
jgi:hypothetical protein